MAVPPSSLRTRVQVGTNAWSPLVDRLNSPSHAPAQVTGRDPAGGAALYRLRMRDAGGQVYYFRTAIGPDQVVQVVVPCEMVLEAQAEAGPACLVSACLVSTAWDAPWPVEVV